MKLFIKLGLLILVAAVAAPFFITGQDGEPLMTLDGLRAPALSLPDLSDTAKKLGAGLGDAAREQGEAIEVFKWRDEKGVWHFSETQNQDRTAEKILVNPELNLLHFETTAGDGQGDMPGRDEAMSEKPARPPLPLAGVSKLIDDAGNVDQLQRERLKNQERALQNN